jgi:hypothetical protein
MNHAKHVTTVLLLSAIGCGGKLLDMPNGYGPIDGAAEGEDGGGGSNGSSGSSGGQGSSGAGSSGASSSSGGGGTGACGGGCGRGQTCCVPATGLGGAGGMGAGGGGTPMCTAAGACQGISVSCFDSTGCSGGQVCCFSLGGTGGAAGGLAGLFGGGGAGGFSGAAACQAPGAGCMFQLCSKSAECPKGDTCQVSPIGMGSYCAAPRGDGGGGGGGGGAGGFGGFGGGAGGAFCLSPDTPVLTPEGERPAESLRVGDIVMSMDHGQVRAVPLVQIHRQPVIGHHVVSATLANGRVIHVSEGHPTADNRLFRDLKPGDKLGDVTVVSLESIAYDHDATYDILPGSDTGTYFAAGALIGSTLR